MVLFILVETRNKEIIMGKLAEQVAALEARRDGDREEWVVVVIGAYNFRVARWDRNRYQVEGQQFSSQDEAESHLSLMKRNSM